MTSQDVARAKSRRFGGKTCEYDRRVGKGLARLEGPVALWMSLECVRAPETADGRPQSSLILSNGLLSFVGRELAFPPTPAPPMKSDRREQVPSDPARFKPTSSHTAQPKR
ncbi:hypothetical protein [Rhodospira trueperi]|uniref:Uncharacterized protein n=1 Tax=Rhodospira trueperi TaxID=69960 RepID=A0A1G7HF57_9PROT|nr:hypothetical protein [Rhodospira trueperi]SDE99001.1 hypothetical protein SAMN05421720_12029 [Rhodospira trueperi]